MENSPVQIIEKELKNIKSRYQKKYGAVFFDVKVKDINNNIVLDGLVLSGKQKNEVFLAVKEIVKKSKIENNIKVLGDPIDGLEVGWGVIISDIADIWARLGEGKNTIARSRASQALKGDFVRILAKKDSWFLVQTRDLAIGWIDSAQLTVSKWEIIKKEWLKTKRAMRGEAIEKHLAKSIQNKFLSFLKRYLNVNYLLGGMTEKGIDCSGLTERFYWEILGILMPRHSSDQALCGKKIELKSAHFGDLVYLRHKITKLAHVGIVVEKFEKSSLKRKKFDNVLILNSRLENGRATIEDLSEILKSYNLILIKRIIK